MVLLDLQLLGDSGLDLYRTPELLAYSEVVLITGHASLETSVQALRYGAADYLTKPVSQRQLNGVLARAMRPQELRAEIGQLEQEWAHSGDFGQLWGRSEPMRRIYQQIGRVAATSLSVHNRGERHRQGGGGPLGSRPEPASQQALPGGELRRDLA